MCTDLRLLNPGNFRISARNLDFDKPMDSWVGFVPKGTKFRSIEPAQNQAQAVSWTTRYDYVGLVSIPAHLADLPTPFLFDRLPPDLKAVSCDGINEKGLSAAALWNDDADFPDAAGRPIPGSSLISTSSNGCSATSRRSRRCARRLPARRRS